ncbi:hypothetical protein O6H91_10G030700 [Diphasiastrum complanatum]|uniref:Uncharacterized protein n=3 Tax=Diphasiastrum complanatum TaxID=34168 RepID=A0ACC2CFN6_DIPCM|nr:hypothetical protein O6H91_10G030700 [Diphasiastrum complanatum]KAJ7540785.1 hypothetical protein O6H91_10G030700 [Diphasiastrum complanatum]
MSELELESFPKSGLLTIDHQNSQDNVKRRRVSDFGSTSRTNANSANIVLQGSLSLSSTGLVDVILLHDRLIWKNTKLHGNWDSLPCWRQTNVPCELPIAEIYAVESLDDGAAQRKKGSSLFCHLLQEEAPWMNHFAVHSFRRSSSRKCQWIPKAYIFGHEDLRICEAWVESIQGLLDNDKQRPKKLLIFVNPYGGKKAALRTWERVIPLFHQAKVKTKVIHTERLGHAFDVLDKATEEDLSLQDGIVVVGGDGLFNEALNGLLAHRHTAPLGPTPKEVLLDSAVDVEEAQMHTKLESTMHANPVSCMEINENFPFQADLQPLLEENSFKPNAKDGHNSNLCNFELDSSVSTETFTNFANELNQYKGSITMSTPQLRIGIIPAGSTDTVVISTTGSRDAITSALHIILGDNMPLDVVRLISWKSSNLSKEREEPRVRYAASFAGYGFFGDVAKESELFRWMGPARYDYVGAKVFLRHKKYAAEISFLDMGEKSNVKANSVGKYSYQQGKVHTKNINQVICRMNCPICARGKDDTLTNAAEKHPIGRSSKTPFGWETARWRTSHGIFQSVGAAVMSCRNDKAPDGMVAHAHLADGLLDLIMIRDCSRPAYLRQLIELSRRGDNHLSFNFVEHYKTPMFTFISHGEESVWSADGELFPAHKLSAQVFRGLVNIFASGPEV